MILETKPTDRMVMLFLAYFRVQSDFFLTGVYEVLGPIGKKGRYAFLLLLFARVSLQSIMVLLRCEMKNGS